MRAARCDVDIVTGAQWTRDVQLVTPGTPVPVETATPGSAYYLGGLPLTVHSVRNRGDGWVELTLGDGTYGSPSSCYPTGATIAPADPVPALEASASFAVPVPGALPDDPPTVDVVPIPAVISADGSTVTLMLDAAATAALADRVGAYSWDVYVRSARWDWQRIAEGTLTIMAGDTR